MKKRKLNYKKILFFILIVVIIILIIIFNPFLSIEKEIKMLELTTKTLTEIKDYANQLNLKLEIKEEYNNSLEKGKIISQSIKEGTKIKEGDLLTIIISLGKRDKDCYLKHKVNELGRVPIMMYHGIQDLTNDETVHIGGNIDKEGYQRTAEAFYNDLEFYYKNDYRMIRLTDYVDGIIEVEIGKSPIILTFDDGLKNNIRIIGLDDNGELIIDSKSAVGILEEFKNKYPDFKVTATFFLNGELFGQPKYNEKILKWLINNGYDIGNHSYGHDYLNKISPQAVSKTIGRMYYLLGDIIKDKYVNIVALPFGLPSTQSHENFASILESTYEEVTYKTKAVLKEAWESELSPFHQNFNPLFLKRIRAYDNLGKEFDIEHNFKLIEEIRYISDGDKNTIVIPKEKRDKISEKVKLEVIEY